MTQSSQPACDASFRWLKSNKIPSLHLEVQEFEHIKTGAVHIHLAADDDQNSFLVAFKTVPTDSTGVAHILEHTSLCGSQRYPVRDPFFMMTRRSLNTFMNAFTASDWTAYPFASRNRKDFDNLLQVYLDATFFPSLNELDFAQEGHRLEFEEADNSDSPLVYKGVVFNEMKGAMSSPVSTLWQSLSSSLFPTITYHYNSGGAPENIPDLTWEELKAFHAAHYHPSNALFMSYGDIPAAELQQRFHDLALKEFKSQDLDIHVSNEERYSAPQIVEDRYALDGEESTEGRTHIVMGWLLDRNIDTETLLKAHILSGVLLDNSASPLRQILETSDLGHAPSPLCGLDDSTREMVFACGLEGSDPDKREAVESLILETLQRVANEGVPQEMVVAVLHQLELSQREVKGDGFPYGLQLMVHSLSSVLHGAEPAQVLDLDPVLESLGQSIQNPQFIRHLAQELLDNPHRVTLVMQPDKGLSGEREAHEAEMLAKIKAGLSEVEINEVIRTTHALEERQLQQDDPELLPKVTLEDIPKELHLPEGEHYSMHGAVQNWFDCGTNGLVYQQLIVEIPKLSDAQIDLLPLYCDLITEVGCGGRDYLETQALHAAVTGGIGASTMLRGNIDDNSRYQSFLVISGKALARNHGHLDKILHETFFSPRFDELQRIRELISQDRMRQVQRITGSGHSLAMGAASSSLSVTAAVSHRWAGLEGIRLLKELDDDLNNSEQLQKLCNDLAHLHQLITQSPYQHLLIGEEEYRQQFEQQMQAHWQDSRFSPLPEHLQLPEPEAIKDQIWTTSTQVNFCARAFPAVTSAHADAPALMVLAGYLRNNYLHRAIREQGGAYGGGASFDPDSATFRFYSYRDPRLQETLNDFTESVSWFLEQDHQWQGIEEAILGVISSIDKPGSPAGEAKSAFHAKLHGRTPEHRNRVRNSILEVRETDLKRVAQLYLQPDNGHSAVITHPDMQEELVAQGYQHFTI